MSRFGFVGASYRSQSVLADSQTCMNWYLESIESGLGRGAYALYQTPGLNQLYNLGAAPVRGMDTFLGRTFCVAGTSLYELLAPNTAVNKTNWSTAANIPITSDGNPVSIAHGGTQLLIASAGNAYVFNLATNTLTQLPAATFDVSVIQVGYADGFFFALLANVAPTPWQINSSQSLDATTWEGTNFTEVTVFPDNPNGIFFNQRLMWVFGPKGIQPYSNTGDFPFPFDVIPGTYVENGLLAPFSMVRLDNSIFWLGADERGNGMVWRMNGFTPQRVSNHAIEFAMQSYATIADAVAFSYQDQGHSFYVISFPTANKTWVYDVATQQWHERGFFQNGIYTRHRAAFHTFNFGVHLVGDPTTGAVYQMAINIYSDFGNPIVRRRRAPHVSKELQYLSHKRLQVDAEVGIGPNLQGLAPATVLTLADSTSALWSVRIDDVGALKSVAGSSDYGEALYLNDPASNTSWKISIVPETGVPIPVSVPFAQYPGALTMVSATGLKQFTLTVRQVAPGIGQFVTNLLGIVGRGPLWTLRWSSDGGQTFSNGQARDGGQIGAYRRRLLWNRLGRARDRVYELEFSEACPARVIDAYLEAEGYEPAERLNKEIAKRA
jgi:hypothetical protein